MKIEKFGKYDHIEEELLQRLIKLKHPVLIHELCKQMSITDERLMSAIDSLRRSGYDIKSITSNSQKYYCLVRYGSAESDGFYRVQGEIELPAIFTADWHIGSKGFSEIAFRKLVRDVIKHKVKTVVICGDIFQGKGVFRTEAEELVVPDTDGQMRLGKKYFKEFPSHVKCIGVIGNHEGYLKGSYQVGFDMVKNLAEIVPSFSYYGHVALLNIKKKFTVMMMHGGGAPSYAVSYKAQKLWDSLAERPTILAFGHLHQLEVLPRPHKNERAYIFQCGTLQREAAYLLNKGIISDVGWIILHDINEEEASFTIHRPIIF